MRKHRLFHLLSSVIIISGISMQSSRAEVWMADLAATIAATKGANQITYTITVRNIGDDSGRDITVYHTPNYEGALKDMSILSVASRDPSRFGTTCETMVVAGSALAVKCTLESTMGVGQTEIIDVVVSNPGDFPRIGVAQVMGFSPDPRPCNNASSVSVP